YCELSVDAQCETHWVWGDKPFRLFYRFPPECRAHISKENGNPFLAAFLVPAMRLGEALEIEAPVSKRLYESLPVLQDIYRSWDRRLTSITVRASIRADDHPVQSSRATALFFSLGVDSSFSLLKNIQRNPYGDDAVTHLINVLGFDIYLWESESHNMVRL